MSDNRNYVYAKSSGGMRDEYLDILGLVPEAASVVDLGCGNGALLALLRDKKKCTGVGVEISASGVLATREKGIQAFEGPIDRREGGPLSHFTDQQFDFAICNVTLQMVMYPEILLAEMRRIARYQIVSFPNFAFIGNRLDLLLRGRMPRPMLFGYDWHSTGHIHQLSIRDFRELIGKLGFKVLRMQPYVGRKSFLKRTLARAWPNLFATTSIFRLEGSGPSGDTPRPSGKD